MQPMHLKSFFFHKNIGRLEFCFGSRQVAVFIAIENHLPFFGNVHDVKEMWLPSSVQSLKCYVRRVSDVGINIIVSGVDEHKFLYAEIYNVLYVEVHQVLDVDEYKVSNVNDYNIDIVLRCSIFTVSDIKVKYTIHTKISGIKVYQSLSY